MSRRRSVSGSARGDGAGPSRPPVDPLSEGEFTWTSDEDHIKLQECHYRHMRWESEAKRQLKHGTSKKPRKYKILDYFYFESELHIGNLKEDTTALMRWKMENESALRGVKATGLVELLIRTLIDDVTLVSEEKEQMSAELHAYRDHVENQLHEDLALLETVPIEPQWNLRSSNSVSAVPPWTYSTVDPRQGPAVIFDPDCDPNQFKMLNHFYYQTKDCVDALKRETIRLFQWEWDQEKKREEGEEEIEKGSIGMRAVEAVLKTLIEDVKSMVEEMDNMQSQLGVYRVNIADPDEVLRKVERTPVLRPSDFCRALPGEAAATAVAALAAAVAADAAEAASAAGNQPSSMSRSATQSTIISQQPTSSMRSSLGSASPARKKASMRTAKVTPKEQSVSDYPM